MRKDIDKRAKLVYIPLIPFQFLFELKEGCTLSAQTRSAAVFSLVENARKVPTLRKTEDLQGHDRQKGLIWIAEKSGKGSARTHSCKQQNRKGPDYL